MRIPDSCLPNSSWSPNCALSCYNRIKQSILLQASTSLTMKPPSYAQRLQKVATKKQAITLSNLSALTPTAETANQIIEANWSSISTRSTGVYAHDPNGKTWKKTPRFSEIHHQNQSNTWIQQKKIRSFPQSVCCVFTNWRTTHIRESHEQWKVVTKAITPFLEPRDYSALCTTKIPINHAWRELGRALNCSLFWLGWHRQSLDQKVTPLVEKVAKVPAQKKKSCHLYPSSAIAGRFAQC